MTQVEVEAPAGPFVALLFVGGFAGGPGTPSHKNFAGLDSRAPADGDLYSSSQPCQSATIRIKYIDHGDGLISYYLHVRE